MKSKFQIMRENRKKKRKAEFAAAKLKDLVAIFEARGRSFEILQDGKYHDPEKWRVTGESWTTLTEPQKNA